MSAVPNILTVVGNLTADPEVRTPGGVKVANISIASTSSKRNRDSGEFEDKPTVYYRASAWRRVADNVEATLHKGDRVVAVVEAVPNSYEKDGVTVNTIQFEVLEIAASLEFASAQITRNPKGQGGAARPQSAPAPASAPAAAAPQQAAPAAAAPAPAYGGDDDFS